MPRPKTLPDTAELVRLRDGGMSYGEIAEQYGVTKGAVFLRMRNAGETGTAKKYDVIPWRVAKEHDKAHPLTMLRLWARAQAGGDLTDAQRSRAERWAADLRDRDVVIHYDRQHGFAYVPRRDVDRFPISNPDVPREMVVSCAMCDAFDVQPVRIMLDGELAVVPVCGAHRKMLANAAETIKPRLESLRWVAG